MRQSNAFHSPPNYSQLPKPSYEMKLYYHAPSRYAARREGPPTECEPWETVAELMEKVGVAPPFTLSFQGQPMKRERTLDSYNLSEGDRVVLAGGKKCTIL